jgi:protein-arginine kinase activator protein McsA
MNDHDLKKCYHCKRLLPIINFRQNKYNPKKRVGVCSQCQKPKIRSQQKYGHSKKGLHAARKARIKYCFNLTLAEYNHIFSLQNGLCAICGKKCKTGQRLAVDHNHKTGKIRGLLCRNCNTGIGFFSDEISLLVNAISYLKEHSDA